MGNQDIYVGLDIGTTSIKVIVAEYVQGQMNIIGVGSQRSEGLSRGVIVDIDKAAAAIRAAVNQAEEKASIKIDRVVAGVPANMLKIEQVTGMIAVGDQSKEITDADVKNVAAAAWSGTCRRNARFLASHRRNSSSTGLMTLRIPAA